jgi:AhpD family alkylhydroperoxidase
MGLGSAFAPGSLPERDRELAVLRTAAAVRSEYELAQHAAIGREAGLTDAEIDAAADPGAAHDWSAPDAAVLRFVDQLLEEGAVDDERWEALAAYSVAQRIELVFLVGFYRMLGGFLRSAGVELEPGVSRPRS